MRIRRNLLITAVTVAGLLGSNAFAEPSENFKVFLCFGQSNIAGGAGCGIIDSFKQTTDRVLAFAFNDCGNPSWQKDTWVPAREPLHCGDGGSGNSTMGPCYVFGKIMADSLPDDTIGIIPCGQSGVNIEVFKKGGGGCTANWCTPYPGGNVYNWMLNKCKKAVERGVFAGILLHQGESNSNDGDTWLDKVKGIYDDLKEDIPLEEDIPIVAGQLLGDKTLNTSIAKMSTKFTYGYYASSSGLVGGGDYRDLHFDTTGYVKMGERYAVEMMKGLHAANLITGTRPESRKRIVSSVSADVSSNNTAVYTLNGRLVSSGSQLLKNRSSMQPGNMYVVANKSTGKRAAAKLMIAPTGR